MARIVNWYFFTEFVFGVDQTLKMAAMVNIDIWLTEIEKKNKNKTVLNHTTEWTTLKPHYRMNRGIVGMLFKMYLC